MNNDRFKFRVFSKKENRMFTSEAPEAWLGDEHWWVVMQSTGLRDKNGKLIFESDILSIDPECPSLAVVKWVPPSFCVEYAKWDKTLNLPLLNEIHLKYGHVVGNTFENGDLIDE